MSTATDVITIEEASRAASVSLGTLGYWIIAGMLDAYVTAEGRVVRLSDVRRVAGQINPSAATLFSTSTSTLTSTSTATRDMLIQEDRVIDPTPRGLPPAREDLLAEVQARLERLDQQLHRVDQTLLGQIGQVDRLEAGRSRDAEALQRVQLTLEQHAEALRRLEAQPVAAHALQIAQPSNGHLPRPSLYEPSLVLRFRPLTPTTAPAPAAPAPTLRMREVAAAQPAATATPVGTRRFGLGLSLPRLPFAHRKPVRDNS